MEPNEVRYTFKGKEGDHLVGIPARDLTHQDISSFTDEQKELLKLHLKSDAPLYEKVKQEEKTTDKGGKSSG